jgi:glycerophosphoryl diester phosphodiesterase
MAGMPFELQGHRGACGLKPENTLPSFEAALAAGVSSFETDVHLTRDGVPVLCHDPVLHDGIASLLPGQSEPASRAIYRLTLAEVRRFKVDRNSDPRRFPHQDHEETPLARRYAASRLIHAYSLPALDDLLSFVAFCAAGEQLAQHPRVAACARKVVIDLELKRIPFEPNTIGDDFDGSNPGLLERQVIEILRRSGCLERCRVRSFDHRSLVAARKEEPRLATAVLIADTRPANPEDLAFHCQATHYCPHYRFMDEALVGRLHAHGVRVIPWTVNAPEDWQRLVAWGVDGITTDYADRLAKWLEMRGIAIQ